METVCTLDNRIECILGIDDSFGQNSPDMIHKQMMLTTTIVHWHVPKESAHMRVEAHVPHNDCFLGSQIAVVALLTAVKPDRCGA